MMRISIIGRDYNFDAGCWEEHLCAELVIDGARYRLSGPDREIVHLGMPIVDPASGRRLSFTDDPERWARLLPTAYRRGDVRVEVEEMRSPGSRRRPQRGRAPAAAG